MVYRTSSRSAGFFCVPSGFVLRGTRVTLLAGVCPLRRNAACMIHELMVRWMFAFHSRTSDALEFLLVWWRPRG